MNLISQTNFTALRGAGLANDRLNGWKSIAAHFGRDRSTVIRWARERGLPVYRLPGGRVGTVYALRNELDRWAGMPEAEVLLFTPTDTDAVESVSECIAPDAGLSAPNTHAPPSFDPVLRRPHRGRLLHWLVIAVAGISLCASLFAWSQQGEPELALLPTDPAIRRDFMAARDLVAEREAMGLERAIGLLEQVTRRAPDFAPGHANLAEAFILSREFGVRANADAFARARRANNAALRLDPDLVSGHRIAGFIAYWADNDFVEAQAAFHRALALAPNDVQSHFWYGNILSDHGDHAAGLQELESARLMQPGSVAIRTDLAWAQWTVGQDAIAAATLHDIAQRYPSFAVANDCLALMAMMRGDMDGYVHHFDLFAQARGEQQLKARASQLRAAQANGPAAIRDEILHQAVAEAQHDPSIDHKRAAAVASVSGDRSRLISLLRLAGSRGEQWGNDGFAMRMRQRWQNDHDVLPLLDAMIRT